MALSRGQLLLFSICSFKVKCQPLPCRPQRQAPPGSRHGKPIYRFAALPHLTKHGWWIIPIGCPSGCRRLGVANKIANFFEFLNEMTCRSEAFHAPAPIGLLDDKIALERKPKCRV